MDSLVVGSKVKAYIKGKGLHTSGDALEGVSKQVAKMLDAAVARCKENKRMTLRPCDL